MMKIFREIFPCILRTMSGKHADCACAEQPCCDMYLKHFQIRKAYKTLILMHCYFYKKVTTFIYHCKPDCCPKTGEQEGRRGDVEGESHINAINEKRGQCKENL